jgi:alkylhydroperoxidase/carboxymuconolactone decarboxylase family protein YurZ
MTIPNHAAWFEKHHHGFRGSRCPYSGENREVVKVAEHKPSNPMDVYDEFFSLAYQAGAMDVKTKHLIALAASLAAGCQP